MTLTFALVVQVFLSATIVYAYLNLFLRYQAAIRRGDFILILALCLLGLWYLEDLNETLFFINVGFALAIRLFFWFRSRKRKQAGYVLLLERKATYDATNAYFQERIQDWNDARFCYQRKRPFLIVFTGVPATIRKKWLNTWEKSKQSTPLLFHLEHWIGLLVTLLALILIWRF